MILFCDTSALVKLYILEDSSREMQALANRATPKLRNHSIESTICARNRGRTGMPLMQESGGF